MPNQLINQLIITAGQWQQFRERQYEQRFNQLLNELRIMTGTSPEGAVEILLQAIQREKVAA